MLNLIPKPPLFHHRKQSRNVAEEPMQGPLFNFPLMIEMYVEFITQNQSNAAYHFPEPTQAQDLLNSLPGLNRIRRGVDRLVLGF